LDKDASCLVASIVEAQIFLSFLERLEASRSICTQMSGEMNSRIMVRPLTINQRLTRNGDSAIFIYLSGDGQVNEFFNHLRHLISVN